MKERGEIYFNHINNLYYVITNHINDRKVRCMIFDGYNTDHKYINSEIVNYDDLDNENKYYQVGGIY